MLQCRNNSHSHCVRRILGRLRGDYPGSTIFWLWARRAVGRHLEMGSFGSPRGVRAVGEGITQNGQRCLILPAISGRFTKVVY